MTSSDQFGGYEIEDVLGRGSMGVVYRATHELTRREVALKVLFPNVASTEMGEERFKREVRVSAMVDDAGIVEVLDAGKENNEFFYAMELLDGYELDELLSTYDWRRGLACLVDVTSSLAACHEAGIVHRDLKPENIFVVEVDGEPHTKLLDFGMASVRESPRATQTGFTLGTPTYMSPEQAMDATEATAASDVWSIGVILYEMLAGRLPFDGDSSTQVMLEVIEESPPSLDPDQVEAPERLVEIADRCLEKEPEDRFTDASELHAALLEVYESLEEAPALPTASQHDATRPSRPAPTRSTHPGTPGEPADPESDTSHGDEAPEASSHEGEPDQEAEPQMPSLYVAGETSPWVPWAIAGTGILATGIGVAFVVLQYLETPPHSSSSASTEATVPEDARADTGESVDAPPPPAFELARTTVGRAEGWAQATTRTARAVIRGRRKLRQTSPETASGDSTSPPNETTDRAAAGAGSGVEATAEGDDSGSETRDEGTAEPVGAVAESSSESGRPSTSSNDDSSSSGVGAPGPAETSGDSPAPPPSDEPESPDSPGEATSESGTSAETLPNPDDLPSTPAPDAGSTAEQKASNAPSTTSPDASSGTSTESTASESSPASNSDPPSSESNESSKETSDDDSDEKKRPPFSF